MVNKISTFSDYILTFEFSSYNFGNLYFFFHIKYFCLYYKNFYIFFSGLGHLTFTTEAACFEKEALLYNDHQNEVVDSSQGTLPHMQIWT